MAVIHSLCRPGRRDHRLHLRHVGGRGAGPGHHHDRRRSPHAAAESRTLSAPGHPTQPHPRHRADPGPSGDALPASGAPPFCRRPDDSCRRRVGAPLTRPDGRLRGAPIPPTTAGGHRLARVAGRCAVTLQSSVQQHPRDPATPLCAGGLCLLRRGGRFEGGRVCLRRKGHRGHGHQWPSCQTLTASTGYSSIRTFSRRLSLIQTRSTTSVTRNSPSERQNPR